MNRILTIIIGFIWYWLSAYAVFAQDTTPRGPAEWTTRNWIGFFIQIGIFVLVIIGIYKLALGDKKERGDNIPEPKSPESSPYSPAQRKQD